MVGFGEKIAAEAYPPWADSYLNYNQLKLLIDQILAVRTSIDSGAAGSDGARVHEARKNIFQGTFDSEIVKVLKFYAQQRDRILGEVRSLQADVDAVPADIMENEDIEPREKLKRIDDLTRRLQVAARDVQHLLAFVGLNMQGMRKILKKFAKNVDPTPPTPGYLTLEIHHPHDPGWKLLQGTYLSQDVQQDLDAMILHKRMAQAAGTIRELSQRLGTYRKEVATASSPDLGEEERRATLVRMDTLLRDLGTAEANADRNASFVSGFNWAVRAGIFEPPPPDEKAVATRMALVLNCANSALYMANYNLIVPNIRSFLLHIGASPTQAGIIIGCCDLASMPSTVGYSFWTNSVYRAPLVFSGISCLIGNLVLCLSYDARSLPLLFVARLATGCGAARAVSRRYIADFVAKRDRTAASAAFVGSSALGMAAGPLLAKAFQSFPTTQWHSPIGVVTFDSITMGAYSMIACWAVFTVATACCFPNPPIHQREAHQGTLQQPLLSEAENGEAAAVNGNADSSGSGGTSSAMVKKSGGFLSRSDSFRAAFQPTMVCVYALLVLKTAQQAFLDSLPLFTTTAYGWSDGTNGLYVGCLCLGMLPVTFAVGAVSQRVSDRILTAFSLMLTLLGCGQLFFGPFPRIVFFTGGVWVLIGTIIMEGAAMSLESKVIHPSFAEGTWNAGLLSTEAGTLGRFTGNLLLSVSSRFTGLDTVQQVTQFAHVLFSCVGVIVVSNLAWFMALYRRIQEG